MVIKFGLGCNLGMSFEIYSLILKIGIFLLNVKVLPYKVWVFLLESELSFAIVFCDIDVTVFAQI